AATPTHQCVRYGGAAPVISGIFNATLQDSRAGRTSVQWQRIEIDKVAGDVKGDHNARSEHKREWQIPARIFHLPGCEGDIVPGVDGTERSDLGDGDHGDSADQDTPADI